MLEVWRSGQLGGTAAFFNSGGFWKDRGLWLASSHWHISGIRVQGVSSRLGDRWFAPVSSWRVSADCSQFWTIWPSHCLVTHWEEWEQMLFLPRAAQVNRLPVDLVVVTETRTGWGGKAAVLQAFLGDRNLAQAVLRDDNLEVCSEIQRVCGTPLNIKTQRRERWSGRTAWNIGEHLHFVEEFLCQCLSSIRVFSVSVAFDILFGCTLRHGFCALVLDNPHLYHCIRLAMSSHRAFRCMMFKLQCRPNLRLV